MKNEMNLLLYLQVYVFFLYIYTFDGNSINKIGKEHNNKVYLLIFIFIYKILTWHLKIKIEKEGNMYPI